MHMMSTSRMINTRSSSRKPCRFLHKSGHTFILGCLRILEHRQHGWRLDVSGSLHEKDGSNFTPARLRARLSQAIALSETDGQSLDLVSKVNHGLNIPIDAQ